MSVMGISLRTPARVPSHYTDPGHYPDAGAIQEAKATLMRKVTGE
jgi:hypothetical protein